MANQRDITLYDVSATPSTVILQALPVADEPAPTVCYLYPLPAAPGLVSDVRTTITMNAIYPPVWPVGDNPSTLTLYDVNATPETIGLRPIPNYANVAPSSDITLTPLGGYTVAASNVVITLRSLTVPEPPPEEAPPITYWAILRRWSGAVWEKAKLMVNAGGSFQPAEMNVWHSGAWRTVDVTGEGESVPGTEEVDVLYGAYADRPAAGTDGRLYVPTDGYYPAIDNGSAWKVNVNGVACNNPPAAASFTAVNQANSTLVADGDGLLLTHMGSNGTGINTEAYLQSLPAAPYSFIVGLDYLIMHPLNYGLLGICLTDGTLNTSEAVNLNLLCGASGITTLAYQQYTNYAWSGDYYNHVINFAMPCKIWFKIQDDNTNRIIYTSFDKRNWALLWSTSRTDHITPTHGGLIVYQGTTAVATNRIRVQAKIFDWSLA
jgi:hypothetical protein